MSEADKLFEELGYNKELFITYSIKILEHQYNINFNGIDKIVEIKEYYYNKSGFFETKTLNINDMSNEIQQAINKKRKELGWIEE